MVVMCIKTEAVVDGDDLKELQDTIMEKPENTANEMVLSGRRSCPLLKDSNTSRFMLVFSFRLLL